MTIGTSCSNSLSYSRRDNNDNTCQIKRLYRAIFGILAVSLFSTAIASAQVRSEGTVSVCIGDICEGSGEYNLDCNFAYAHPTDTDEQAAKYICTIVRTHIGYRYVRIASIAGGRCGEIVIQVRCIDN